MWVRKLSILLLFLCIFSVLRSENVTQAQPQADTIVYGMPYDFSEFSAYTADSYATQQWVSAVYASLLKRSNSADTEWIGDMVSDLPTISNNGLTFTFTLRDKLYFSNGKKLTADDVEFSLKMALTPEVDLAGYSTYSQFLTNDSFIAISSTSFSLTLTQGYAFPYGLFSFPLVPQETYGKQYQSCLDGVVSDCAFNNPDGSSAISAGPYMIETLDTDNQIVTATANPHYWNAGSIKTNKIVFERIADKAAAISALSDNMIDIMDSQYVPGINELKGITGISETLVYDPASQEMAVNNLNPYFGIGELIPNSIGETNKTQVYENARLLRKAMSMIMDRQSFVDNIMEGLAGPSASPMPAAAYGFDPTIKPDPFNLTTAKGIMTSLGFNYTQLGNPDINGVYQKGFFNITVLSPDHGGPARTLWEDVYSTELPKLGIHVTQHVSTGWAEIVPRTFGSSVNPPSYADGGYDVFFVGYGWNLDWNPQGLYDSSGSCSTGDCSNFYNFDLNETMTPIANVVREYLTTLDYNLRMQYVRELQQLLHYWNPAIPILNPMSHWSWNDQVSGIDGKLISVASQQWETVSKTGFQVNTNVKVGNTTTERVSVSYSEYFLLGFPVLFLLIKYQKKRDLFN